MYASIPGEFAGLERRSRIPFTSSSLVDQTFRSEPNINDLIKFEQLATGTALLDAPQEIVMVSIVKGLYLSLEPSIHTHYYSQEYRTVR